VDDFAGPACTVRLGGQLLDVCPARLEHLVVPLTMLSSVIEAAVVGRTETSRCRPLELIFCSGAA
jgi:hypothetical protein